MQSTERIPAATLDRSTKPLGPGTRIGVMGSGQLGRMLALAARRMGMRVHVYSPEADSPAGQVADSEIVADYDDHRAVAAFARDIDVLTLEFENVPTAAVRVAGESVPVRPGAEVLYTVQNRVREKTFLRDNGIACTPFFPIANLADLRRGLDELGYPAVLKTAAAGYDGKGQVRIDTQDEAAAAWEQMGGRAAILEGFVHFQRELSVLVARSPNGDVATYPPLANAHANHILDVTVARHPELEKVADSATSIAQKVAIGLDAVGLICIEFFQTEQGDLLVNEIAPRPHNSGHLTIDAAVTSQFEQQARAVCGLPLGATDILRPAAMANLLGDLWAHAAPRWERALAFPEVKLHLYGKAAARPGRKMGHLTATAPTAAEAEELVRAARAALTPPR